MLLTYHERTIIHRRLLGREAVPSGRRRSTTVSRNFPGTRESGRDIPGKGRK